MNQEAKTIGQIIEQADAKAKTQILADFEQAIPGFTAACVASELSVDAILSPRHGLSFTYKECALFVGFQVNMVEGLGLRASLYYFADGSSLPCKEDLLAKMLSLLLIEPVDKGEFPRPAQYLCSIA